MTIIILVYSRLIMRLESALDLINSPNCGVCGEESLKGQIKSYKKGLR